jgi:coenzyme F420-reducing hydrogenase delta subunit
VEKRVLLLHCAESGKKALHRMAQLGHKLPGDARTFELPCTGRVNDVLLMETLQDGFDGVLVIGCHKDNCKYLDGNMRAEKRVNHVEKILADAGIDKKYVDMVFVAPDEGSRLSRVIKDFYKKVKEEA